MNTIHDNKSRQELFNPEQHNDNHSPTTFADYESNETVLYEMSGGEMRVFPHFCMTQIHKDDKGQICIFYSTGNIIIKGRNLEELVRRLAAKKISVIRITHPDDDNTTCGDTENAFCIDSITFEEN